MEAATSAWVPVAAEFRPDGTREELRCISSGGRLPSNVAVAEYVLVKNSYRLYGAVPWAKDRDLGRYDSLETLRAASQAFDCEIR